MKKLKAEELAELEGTDAADADAEGATEPPEKRQKRCKGKTETLLAGARVGKDGEIWFVEVFLKIGLKNWQDFRLHVLEVPKCYPWGRFGGMLGIVSTELAVKPCKIHLEHQMAINFWGIGSQKMFEVGEPQFQSFPVTLLMYPQQHSQETDVSIAREVDKDLEANGEAAEDAGESASARHAAREKQREAGRSTGSKVDGDGDSTPYSQLMCIWRGNYSTPIFYTIYLEGIDMLYEYYVYVIVCI